MKLYKKSLFIFRRDLRLPDNTGLIEALKLSEKVIPIFIFTPEQIKKNIFKSNNAVQFMVESLKDLDRSLKKKRSRLHYFFGKQDEIVKKLIKKEKIDAIFVNNDYTPYAILRDKYIKKVCQKYNVDFKSYEDILLYDPKKILKNDGTIYTKFTPYFKKAIKILPKKSVKNNYSDYKRYKKISFEISEKDIEKYFNYNKNISVIGGRTRAKKILKNINKYRKYNKERNILSLETTRLSAYIKFGNVSIREVYQVFLKELGKKNDLIKQLYWREFYYNIGIVYPRIYNKYGNLKEKYNNIKWENDMTLFKKWKQGLTGYPIVDAAMREMNQTGFMHNRGRLIVSNFLIKILLVDWKKGEQYFSRKLVDIDFTINVCNWSWSSGSGADSQPYFRVFNPWLQSKKFDRECIYIKKWIPELKNVNNKHIHLWSEYHSQYNVGYPEPIVDYKVRKKKGINMYKKIF